MSKYQGYVSSSHDSIKARFILYPPRDMGIPFCEWNGPAYLKYMNCYSFACDALDEIKVISKLVTPEMEAASDIYPRVFIPHPGVSAGRPFTSFDKESLHEAVTADGFIYIETNNNQRPESIPADHYLIAAFSRATKNEYHFYRFYEGDKTWYGMNGWIEGVSNEDLKGQLITDPLQVLLDQQFAGYYFSPPYRPKTNIIVEDRDGILLAGKPPAPR